MVKFLILSAFLFSTTSFAGLCQEQLTSYKGKVDSVIDGDTFVFKTGENYKDLYIVDLAGLDSPEYLPESQGKPAEAAKSGLENLIPVNSDIEIFLDQKRCNELGTVYAYVYYKGVEVGYKHILNGNAILFCVHPNIKKCSSYSRATELSIQQKSSFLSLGIEVPYVYRWRKLNTGKVNPYSMPATSLGSFKVEISNYIDTIPLTKRVFFEKPEDVKTPYRANW